MRSRHQSSEALVLSGSRVVLRTLTEADFDAWSEVRLRCQSWLLKWEPRPASAGYPTEDRANFQARCAVRERERQLQTGFSFGIFVAGGLRGELTLSSIQRGPFQSASIGYWIDEAMAGRGYVPEAVIVATQYAFEELGLHRIEISIIPRNTPSLRVMEKLAYRREGLAERYLEIDGVWEDHVKFAITAEDWQERRGELLEVWVDAP
jgi:ribosomal-protein-alanine N-acetyltransferase